MVGLDPFSVDWMTLRDADLALAGYDLKYKEEWRQAVLIANSNGAGLTLDDVLKPPYQPTQDDIAALEARATAAIKRMEARDK